MEEKKKKIKIRTFYITPIAWGIEVILIILFFTFNFGSLIKGMLGLIMGLLGLYIAIRTIEYPTEKDLEKAKKDYPDFYRKHKKESKEI